MMQGYPSLCTENQARYERVVNYLEAVKDMSYIIKQRRSKTGSEKSFANMLGVAGYKGLPDGKRQEQEHSL